MQVAADIDFNTVEETREEIDPKSVMRSESGKADKTVDNLALGIPGLLSNQPPVKKPADTTTAANDGAMARPRQQRHLHRA